MGAPRRRRGRVSLLIHKAYCEPYSYALEMTGSYRLRVSTVCVIVSCRSWRRLGDAGEESKQNTCLGSCTRIVTSSMDLVLARTGVEITVDPYTRIASSVSSSKASCMEKCLLSFCAIPFAIVAVVLPAPLKLRDITFPPLNNAQSLTRNWFRVVHSTAHFALWNNLWNSLCELLD